MKKFLSLLSGGVIGIALGLILGLSVSPVVQTFLGIFASILAIFLGAEKPAADSSGNVFASLSTWTADKMLRIIGFGSSLSIGIILGIMLRTHEVLEMPLSTRVDSWRAAGYSSSDALKFSAIEKLGINTDQNIKRDTGKKQEVINSIKPAGTGALFAANGKATICSGISFHEDDSDEKIINTIISAYKHDPSKRFIPLGQVIDSLRISAVDKRKLLLTINQLLCSGN